MGEGGRSCCLHHYDALRTKIDVTHPLYLNTFETIDKVERDNYDQNSIAIDFSIIFFQKITLDLNSYKIEVYY